MTCIECTHTQTNMHRYVHIICIYTCVDECIHTHTLYTQARMHACRHTHTHAQMRTRTCTCTCMHTFVHTHMDKYIHTCMHTFMRTCMKHVDYMWMCNDVHAYHIRIYVCICICRSQPPKRQLPGVLAMSARVCVCVCSIV